MTCAIAVNSSRQFFDKSLPDEETFLSDDDFRAARVARSPDADVVDDFSMYNPNRFEGDIVNSGLSSRTIKGFMGEAHPRMSGIMRNAVRQTYLMWTDARIPYTISSQYTSFSRSKIAEAMAEYSKLTCIDFAPKSAADQDYIHIVPDDGCYSLVGRVGGKQPVSLGDGCIQKGIIIHELMHAVGFFHEQNQFDKYSLNMIDHLGTAYDYNSVMHYAPTAFSKNGKPTIEPRKKNVEIGQRRGFSENDIYKINKLYKCPQLVPTTSSPEEEVDEYNKQVTALPEEHTTEEPEEKELPPAPVIRGSCRDKRRDCEFLSHSGHCDSRFSKKFMSENCPKSCKKCNTTCEDSRSWCERWANSGMCTQSIFKDYMKKKCAKSCQLC
ncbi:hypothetical protein QR680_001754 [Steinernema hermaphroditum]|uniref:Metalloendopeptidase n=1 Tax=Steinernema hermaphroditum TaxID=289476 RepID=A0AA39LGQ6_9BILA|nr:hypothetical protein QR680_001754 [Steinernema hermaphroditum]